MPTNAEIRTKYRIPPNGRDLQEITDPNDSERLVGSYFIWQDQGTDADGHPLGFHKIDIIVGETTIPTDPDPRGRDL